MQGSGNQTKLQCCPCGIQQSFQKNLPAYSLNKKLLSSESFFVWFFLTLKLRTHLSTVIQEFNLEAPVPISFYIVFEDYSCIFSVCVAVKSARTGTRVDCNMDWFSSFLCFVTVTQLLLKCLKLSWGFLYCALLTGEIHPWQRTVHYVLPIHTQHTAVWLYKVANLKLLSLLLPD